MGNQPNDPYYDNQLVILNLTVADKGGTVSSPHSFMYINVTFFGFPGWVRLVGLAIGGLATIFGVKDIIIRFIPERQAIPQQVPASSVPTSPPSIPQEVMHTILPTAAAAPPQAPIPDEVKPRRSRQRISLYLARMPRK